MAISKRKYVEKVGAPFMENPRKFLRGHKIQTKHWPIINSATADGGVLKELMYFAHVLKFAAKGPIALKKAKNLQISSYHTEGELIDRLNDDVTNFVSGLDAKDAEEFENSENIHVIGYFSSFEGGSPVQTLKLSTLLRNGYKGKFGRGNFIVVFFGNSAIRTQELKFAKTKAKVNARKVKKLKSPAVIKAALRKKTAGVVKRINSKISKAEATKRALSAEMQEFNAIASQFGLDPGASTTQLKRKINSFDSSSNKMLKGMSDSDKLVWSLVQEAIATGDKRKAATMVRKANSPAITKLFKGEAFGSSEVLGTRNRRLKAKGQRLREGVVALRERIANAEIEREAAKAAGDAAKAFKLGKQISAAKFKIKGVNAQIREIKAKLGMVKTIRSGNYKPATLKSKAELLASVNAEIDELVAAGASEKEALSAALSVVDAPDDVKEQVKQEAEAEMQQGVPVQLAAQQAIQSSTIGMQQGDADMKSLVKDWL